MISEFTGGDFMTGFAAGGLGSLSGSAFSAFGGNFAQSTVGQVSFSALGGGVGAELTGGDFWRGAATGATVGLLNHAAHIQQHNQQQKLQVKAARAFLVREGYNAEQVSKDIVAHGEGGIFSKKFARFNNFNRYKSSFSGGHSDSYSGTNDAYLSLNKHQGRRGSFQLKYYPSRNHSTGIVQSMPGHIFEAGFEWIESKFVNYFGFDDNFLYHMHEGNAINYLNNW
jgi:hypothetical protein